MSTHNIGFYEDLTNIIFELSSNIIKYAPYFFCCSFLGYYYLEHHRGCLVQWSWPGSVDPVGNCLDTSHCSALSAPVPAGMGACSSHCDCDRQETHCNVGLELEAILQQNETEYYIRFNVYEPRHEKTSFLHIYVKTNTQISCAVTTQLMLLRS